MKRKRFVKFGVLFLFMTFVVYTIAIGFIKARQKASVPSLPRRSYEKLSIIADTVHNMPMDERAKLMASDENVYDVVYRNLTSYTLAKYDIYERPDIQAFFRDPVFFNNDTSLWVRFSFLRLGNNQGVVFIARNSREQGASSVVDDIMNKLNQASDHESIQSVIDKHAIDFETFRMKRRWTGKPVVLWLKPDRPQFHPGDVPFLNLVLEKDEKQRGQVHVTITNNIDETVCIDSKLCAFFNLSVTSDDDSIKIRSGTVRQIDKPIPPQRFVEIEPGKSFHTSLDLTKGVYDSNRMQHVVLTPAPGSSEIIHAPDIISEYERYYLLPRSAFSVSLEYYNYYSETSQYLPFKNRYGIDPKAVFLPVGRINSNTLRYPAID